MPVQVPEVFAVFQCAACRATNPIWTSSNHSEHLFGSPSRLMCSGCGTLFPVRSGYLDLHPGDPEPITPIQHMMQFPPIVSLRSPLAACWILHCEQAFIPERCRSDCIPHSAEAWIHSGSGVWTGYGNAPHRTAR